MKTSAIALVFLCPKPNQACLSEGFGHKKTEYAVGVLFFTDLKQGTTPWDHASHKGERNPILVSLQKLVSFGVGSRIPSICLKLTPLF